VVAAAEHQLAPHADKLTNLFEERIVDAHHKVAQV
jgi:hypothetical protein